MTLLLFSSHILSVYLAMYYFSPLDTYVSSTHSRFNLSGKNTRTSNVSEEMMNFFFFFFSTMFFSVSIFFFFFLLVCSVCSIVQIYVCSMCNGGRDNASWIYFAFVFGWGKISCYVFMFIFFFCGHFYYFSAEFFLLFMWFRLSFIRWLGVVCV